MSLPKARVVRQAGVVVVPPPVPWQQRLAEAEAGLGTRSHAVLSAVIGLWPITAVVLVASALLLAAGP